MTSLPTLQVDVLIVGAGPTGLLLAGDVAETGARVVVLEKRGAESNLTRAFAVHAGTLEHLDRRGLATRLIATGKALDHMRVLGGAVIDYTIVPSRFPFVLVTPQYKVEQLLLERAEGLGVRILRGAEVTALMDHGSGVDVEFRYGSVDPGSGVGSAHASYVVGTDGHDSTVRRLLGLEFPGRTVLSSMMLADVQLAESPGDLTVEANENGFFFCVPYGDGWYRVMAWDPAHADEPDSAPLTLDEIRTATRNVLGTDLGMHDDAWISRFHCDERQVETYSRGRVFLAGDAAHVHSPAGGLGMNTGLQDAANLGWKLGAVIRGTADPALLETYNAERHPVGADVVSLSGGLLRGATVSWWPLVRLRNLVVRTVLGFPSLALGGALRVSGIGIRYPPPPGAHPDVGRRAADLVGSNERAQQLSDALLGGRHVVILPEGQDGPPLHTLHMPVEQPILVRPDGYVAYIGPVGEEMDKAIKASGAA